MASILKMSVLSNIYINLKKTEVYLQFMTVTTHINNSKNGKW